MEGGLELERQDAKGRVDEPMVAPLLRCVFAKESLAPAFSTRDSQSSRIGHKL